MAIRIEPSTIDTALLYRFSGRITPDDMDDVRSAEEDFFASLDDCGCLNVIADFSGIDSIAPSLFPQLQRLRMVTDERVCVVVVVGANSYLRALAISLGMVAASPHEFIFSDNADEARSLLAPHPN